MRNLPAAALVALLTVAAVPAGAANEVIGTLEAMVDGERRTWYLLKPDDDLSPTALWVAMGPDRGVASLTGYPSADIELTRDQASGASVPAGDTPVLLVSFAFPVGAETVRHSLPPAAEEGPASVVYAPDWRDVMTVFSSNEGSGEIHATAINASRDGGSRFTGTFHGTLMDRGGGTTTLSEGHFEVSGAQFYAPRQ